MCVFGDYFLEIWLKSAMIEPGFWDCCPLRVDEMPTYFDTRSPSTLACLGAACALAIFALPSWAASSRQNYYVEANTETFNTTQTYSTQTTLTFQPDASSTYFIMASYQVKSTTTAGGWIDAQVLRTTALNSGTYSVINDRSPSGSYHAYGALGVISGTAVPVQETIVIKYRPTNSGDTAYCKNARIIAIKADAQDQSNFSNALGMAVADSGGPLWHDGLSLDISSTADYIILSSTDMTSQEGITGDEPTAQAQLLVNGAVINTPGTVIVNEYQAGGGISYVNWTYVHRQSVTAGTSAIKFQYKNTGGNHGTYYTRYENQCIIALRASAFIRDYYKSTDSHADGTVTSGTWTTTLSDTQTPPATGHHLFLAAHVLYDNLWYDWGNSTPHFPNNHSEFLVGATQVVALEQKDPANVYAGTKEGGFTLYRTILSPASTTWQWEGYADGGGMANPTAYLDNQRIEVLDLDITISGTAYQSDGTTALSGKTVALRISGGAAATTTTASDGTWSLLFDASAGDTLTVYLQDATYKANAVTVTNGTSSVDGVKLIDTNVTVRSDSGSTATTDTILDRWDKNNDATYMLFTVSGGALTMDAGKKMLIQSGTYAPGETVNLVDVEIGAGGAFNPVGNDVNVTGNWKASSTGAFVSSGTVFFNNTATKTIESGGLHFQHLKYAGTGTLQPKTDTLYIDGNFTCASGAGSFDDATNNKNVTVNGNVTMDNGRVDLGGGTWTLGGDFDFADVSNFFGDYGNNNGGYVYLTGINKTMTMRPGTDGGAYCFNGLFISGSITAQILGAQPHRVVSGNGGSILDVSGTLNIPSGVRWNTYTVPTYVRTGGNLTGAGEFYMDTSNIPQNNGVVSVATLTLYRGGGAPYQYLAPGLYTSALVQSTNADTMGFAAGTYTFTGNVNYGGSVIYNTNNSKHIYYGNLTANWQQPGTAGTITFKGGAPGSTQDIDIQNAPSSFENLIVDADGGGTKRLMTTTDSSTVHTRGLTVIGGTLDLNGRNLTFNAGTAAVNNGLIRLQGKETLTNVTNLGTASGTVEYYGDGAGGTASFTINDFGTPDYYNLKISGRSDETFNVGNDLAVAGGLHIDGKTTVSVATGKTLTVSGLLSFNRININNANTNNHPVLFTSPGFAQYIFAGGLNQVSGTVAVGRPDFAMFQNLNAPSNPSGGVKVTIGSSQTWSNLVFDNLNGTATTGHYYLEVAGNGTLTVDKVRFRNRVNGTLIGTYHQTSFNRATGSGTIYCSGTAKADIPTGTYYTNDYGVGVNILTPLDATDTDGDATAGTVVTWTTTPTPITLSDFRAAATPQGRLISWTAGGEWRTVGYRVEARAPGAAWKAVSPLIRARGVGADLARYAWHHCGGVPGAQYRLIEVLRGGKELIMDATVPYGNNLPPR
jgi:hypothetical protein